MEGAVERLHVEEAKCCPAKAPTAHARAWAQKIMQELLPTAKVQAEVDVSVHARAGTLSVCYSHLPLKYG